MQTKLFAAALLVAALALPPASVHALRVAPPPGPTRIVQSDAVFVGRVLQIEPIDVDAKPYPASKTTVKYRVAVVKVNTIIRGLKTEKMVRVGFIPFVQPKPGRPIIGGRRGGPQVTVGQEGLFMISKHSSGKFYMAPDYGYFVSAEQKNFDDEIKTARKVVAMMGNAEAYLKSKDADERLLAASLLISQYRTPKGASVEEPISAAQTKLILNALATAKWQQRRFGDPDPWTLFNQLGAKDGWKYPQKIRNRDDLRDAVQAWIRAHGETYRIKRFVPRAEK
ncbi:MAG: hypothetical protein HYX68_22050 [Planctomycetes bacterium]|nr:hypothetical protein [Planctomycetota bacterium]